MDMNINTMGMNMNDNNFMERAKKKDMDCAVRLVRSTQNHPILTTCSLRATLMERTPSARSSQLVQTATRATGTLFQSAKNVIPCVRPVVPHFPDRGVLRQFSKEWTECAEIFLSDVQEENCLFFTP